MYLTHHCAELDTVAVGQQEIVGRLSWMLWLEVRLGEELAVAHKRHVLLIVESVCG